MTNFGTPVDPKDLPSDGKVLFRTVALGYRTSQEAPQLPPGVSSRMSNFLAIEGGIIPRPGLWSFSTLSGAMTQDMAWVGDAINDADGYFPVAMNVPPAVFSNGSWSTLSQLQGSATTPLGYSLNTLQGSFYFDATNYYNPTSDDIELCFVPQSSNPIQLAYTYNVGSTGARTFSTLTGAPAANYVANFDSRLVFAYIQALSSTSTGAGPTTVTALQRVMWSSRGAPSVYTSPDGGAVDLVDAQGAITRLIAESDRLVVFFHHEIWQGLRAPFPYNFDFRPLHIGVGTNEPWTVASTPWGTMFLGDDFNIWVIPPGGVPQAVGGEIQKLLRENLQITGTARPSATYDQVRGGYLLTYLTKANKSHGIFFRLENGVGIWSPFGFDLGNGFKVARLGTTSNYSVANATGTFAPPKRVLVAGGSITNYQPYRDVFEWTSLVTQDIASRITCSMLAFVENENPAERYIVREVRVDYRADSASSMSLRMTPDFGQTFVTNANVALPVASPSAQTRIGVSLSAVYPGIELRHDSGQSFTIQGVSVVLSSGGNG